MGTGSRGQQLPDPSSSQEEEARHQEKRRRLRMPIVEILLPRRIPLHATHCSQSMPDLPVLMQRSGFYPSFANTLGLVYSPPFQLTLPMRNLWQSGQESITCISSMKLSYASSFFFMTLVQCLEQVIILQIWSLSMIKKLKHMVWIWIGQIIFGGPLLAFS